MSNLAKYQEQKHELEHFRGLAAIAAKSGQHNDKSPEAMLNIMLTAHDLGISPMKALNGGFYLVNGKISMSASMMADRIRKAGHSIKIPEWTREKCVIIGVRKDNNDSIKFEFTMEDAQLAGLNSSPTWKRYPKHMLYARALSTIARTLFPDVVGNAYSEEERFDIMNVPPEKRPLEEPESDDTITVSSRADATIAVEAKTSLVGTPLETLKEHLTIDNISTDYLDEYLRELSEKKKQTVEQLIESALHPQILPRFKNSYAKELAKRSQPEKEVVA